MEVILANPRGFCAGVDRAIAIVERALETLGAPIYVRHEVVHNKFVVERLKKMGAIFIDEINQVPMKATVIYSAHGVSQQVRQQATKRQLTIFDATCPLVTKVHLEVVRHCKAGRDVVLIGHAGHPEVEGTLGQWNESIATGDIYLIETIDDVAKLHVNYPGNITYVTQTTLSVDDTIAIINALKLRFPTIQGPARDDICYATQNRQDAVRELAQQCDLILVVGSKASSNSNRLKELAENCGITSYLIDSSSDINLQWLVSKEKIGVTAGASAPESIVQEVVNFLRVNGAKRVNEMSGQPETIEFALPKALRL